MGRGRSGGNRRGRIVAGKSAVTGEYREIARPAVGSVAIPILGGLMRTASPIVVTRTGAQVAGTAMNAPAGTLGAREGYFPKGMKFLVYPGQLTGNSYDDSVAINDWLRPYLGLKPRSARQL
jgi:hypothetical protein